MDQAPLPYHLSPVYLQVYWTSVVCWVNLLSHIAGCARWLSSGCACWFICRCTCPQLTRCTYRFSLSPLVDSSPGALAAASFLNWWMHFTVIRSCTSGTVIVCGRGCNSGTVIPLFWKSLLRRRLILYGFVGNSDWKCLIRSRFVVVKCHRSCVARDRRVWVGISLGIVFSVI